MSIDGPAIRMEGNTATIETRNSLESMIGCSAVERAASQALAAGCSRIVFDLSGNKRIGRSELGELILLFTMIVRAGAEMVLANANRGTSELLEGIEALRFLELQPGSSPKVAYASPFIPGSEYFFG